MEDTEQQGPAIENGSEWSNGTVHFNRTGPTEKSGLPRKVDHFFRNFSGWTEPIHSAQDKVYFQKETLKVIPIEDVPYIKYKRSATI